MSRQKNVALAFAAALAVTAPALSFGDDGHGLSSLFSLFADTAQTRGDKVCGPAPTTNAAGLLHFKSLQQAGKIEPSVLMMSAAFSKAGEFSICTAPVVAEGGADAYLFLGTLSHQERTILVNPTLSGTRQEEAVFAAIHHARDLFAQNSQNGLSDEVLALPRALKVQRNWLGHITGTTVTFLSPEQLSKLPGAFSQVEAYMPPPPQPASVLPEDQPNSPPPTLQPVPDIGRIIGWTPQKSRSAFML